MPYQATAKTEARKASTRQRILDEALGLVYRGGFSAVAMTQVATAAGIATGTIYRYFPSKSELCTELFRVCTEREVAVVASAATASGPAAQRLEHCIQAFARRAIKGRNLAWALIAEPLDPSLEAERLRYRDAYKAVFAQLIDTGIASGEFAPQVSTPLSAAAIVGALAEALVNPLSPHNPEAIGPDDKQILIDALSQFCLRAVGIEEPLS